MRRPGRQGGPLSGPKGAESLEPDGLCLCPAGGVRPWPRPIFPPPPGCGEGTGACSRGAGGPPIPAVSQAPGPCFNARLQVLTPVRPRGPSHPYHNLCLRGGEGSGPRRAGLACDCDLRGHSLGAASAAAEKYDLALSPHRHHLSRLLPEKFLPQNSIWCILAARKPQLHPLTG